MSTPPDYNIYVFPDSLALQQAVAGAWVDLAREAIAARGKFCMALSGGSTPKALYQLMASAEYRTSVEWDKCHLFFGDERFVPSDHADSNYRMARLALFEQVELATANIHHVDTSLADPESCAQAYDEELRSVLPHDEQGRPVFDLMLQGMGDDGHTASLFPGTSILTETNKIVAAAYVEKFNAWRISVTFPVINHARHVIFLISGKGKAEIIKKVLLDPVSEPILPVQMLSPHGQLDWYLDSDAAVLLPANLINQR